MNPDDLAPGVSVRVATDRHIAGRSWAGVVGTMFGSWRRGEIEDWCLVEVPDDGTVLIGFRPDELEAP